jgi:hypothetical protein
MAASAPSTVYNVEVLDDEFNTWYPVSCVD